MVKKKRCWERSRQCIAQTLSCFQLARHRKAQMHCDIKASWLMHATSRPNCSEHVQMIPDVYSSCHRDALTCAQLYVFRLWEARIKFTLGTCFEQMFCKELLYIIAGSESPVRRYQVPSFAGAKPYGKAQSRLQKHLGRTWSDLIFLNREFGCDGLAATVSRNADQWQSWMIQIRAYSSIFEPRTAGCVHWFWLVASLRSKSRERHGHVSSSGELTSIVQPRVASSHVHILCYSALQTDLFILIRYFFQGLVVQTRCIPLQLRVSVRFCQGWFSQ